MQLSIVELKLFWLYGKCQQALLFESLPLSNTQHSLTVILFALRSLWVVNWNSWICSFLVLTVLHVLCDPYRPLNFHDHWSWDSERTWIVSHMHRVVNVILSCGIILHLLGLHPMRINLWTSVERSIWIYVKQHCHSSCLVIHSACLFKKSITVVAW
jgi:hypothetical protein